MGQVAVSQRRCKMTRNNGWIYCISNASMPGIYKVGMTRRQPVERLAEANRPYTWRSPTDFTLEYVVRTRNVAETERTLHMLLTERWERVNPRQEFFRAPLKDIKHLMNNVAVAVAVIDSDDDEEAAAAEPYYHPSVMPKKAAEPSGAATRMHLRSGRLVK